jgi:ribokinase
MGRVFVIGSVNQDHVLTVDHRPAPGETVVAATLAVGPGGKGANQAVAAVAAGALVTLLARVGDDAAGRVERHDLSGHGVDVSLVLETTGASTGLAFITVTPDGENAVTVAPGANGLLAGADVEAAAGRICACDVLVAQLEVPLETVARAIDVSGPNVHVLLNAAPPGPLTRSLLPRVDTLVVNGHEADALLGGPVAAFGGAGDAALALLDLGPRQVVVTLGARGAVLASTDGCIRIVAPTVAVADTTGAGDVLVGTLAALLSDEQPLSRALEAAVVNAAAAVTHAGARRPRTDQPAR